MARRVNTHPHLDIEHVNRWNARIGVDRRKKLSHRKDPADAKKQEPLDPMDDFIADTDPADKPLDEATIDDVMDSYTRTLELWTNGVLEGDDEWAERMLTLADMMEDAHPEYYGRMITERFKAAEASFAELGLPRAITHDMLMQIGMRTGVDYIKEPHTHRVYFDDPALNDIVLYAYESMMDDIWSVEDGNDSRFTKAEWVNIIVNTYLEENSVDSRYEVLLQEYLYAYDIAPETNDKGNPVGEYADFIRSFNKVYKNAYKHHTETESGEDWYAWDFEEILNQDLPLEIKDRQRQKESAKQKRQNKREVQKIYDTEFPENAWPEVRGLKGAEKFKVQDALFKEVHGVSLWSYYS